VLENYDFACSCFVRQLSCMGVFFVHKELGRSYACSLRGQSWQPRRCKFEVPSFSWNRFPVSSLAWLDCGWRRVNAQSHLWFLVFPGVI
jgi:hypothetical protein